MFSALLGLDDGDGDCGDGVVYRVELDGIELYRSQTVASGEPATSVSVRLDRGILLDLFVDPLGGNDCDESVWAEARLIDAKPD